ncbi:Elongation factor G [Anatilimnocola aggregata]|uniref:Elongation factor G n=1 Tax=Anatilimnocola aggregata TaxID=2528021 RepID=A0A517Y547_9BACT|nr:elongation factor G [Anatilimnocola aggregata]QDU25374.1 Elongation factor G [Anatilimnocola aggregata]
MAKVNVADLRNVAFCGHGNSGKTTLLDKLLVLTGAVSGEPSVDNGSSICDFDPEEKAHKRTIESSIVHFMHDGKRINAIDTPGYADFIGQTIGALRAVETAVIVVNAHSGIEVNTRRVFQEAGKAGVGRMIVINRMDEPNIDFPKLIEQLRDTFGNACALLNIPVGTGPDFKGVVTTLEKDHGAKGTLLPVADVHTQLIESIVEVDEALMEKYFEGEEPSPEKIEELTEQAIARGTLIPIVCCSAKTGVGLKDLLTVLAHEALPPGHIQRLAYKEGHKEGEEGDEIKLKSDPGAPLVAQVFKTRIDPFVQKLTYLRIYSGTLKKDDQVHVCGSRKGAKLGPLLDVQGAETKPIESASAGEIIAIAKMEDLHTGSTLGEFEMPRIPFPVPMVGLAVKPKSHNDEAKLSVSLHKILEEDSTLKLDRDPQTKELVMTGMSDLHLQILRERLHRRDKLDVDTRPPKIPFRETIMASAEGSYRHKKQSGGRGQFGEVHIRMYPLPRNITPEGFCTKDRFPQMKDFHFDPTHRFLWVNSVVGGSIPGNFLPAIEKGFKERIEKGVIAGHTVQDVAVEVHYGKHHDVDSSEAAFKIAGSMAFRNVFQQAKPALLEPIVRMEITVPESHVGDLYSDMSGRGGRVQGTDAAGGGYQTIFAEVPLREVTTYARTLSSMTGGQGSFTMEFSHYDIMPTSVQQEVVSKATMHEEEEE